MTDLAEVRRLINEETFPYELNPEFEVVTNVAVVDLARRVVSGTPIRWCEVHKSREGEDGLCLWVLIEDRWNALGVKDCRIVDRILIDPGGIE